MTHRRRAALVAVAVAAGAALAAGLALAAAKPSPSPAPSDLRSLSLKLAEPYLPQRVNGATDDYRCFVLDPKLDRDVFVTSASITPGQPSLVHHVILFKESGAGAAAAIAKDKATRGKGWTCFGGPNLGAVGETGGDSGGSAGGQRRDGLDSAPWLSAWVPGRTTDAYPDGIGVLLPKGSRIVMQIHYNLLNGARPDSSSVVLGIRPATADLKPVKTLLLAAPIELPCPAGSTSADCDRGTTLVNSTIKYGLQQAFLPTVLLRICNRSLIDYPQRRGDATDLRTSCDTTLPKAITVRGVAGHMHLRGRDIRVTLVHASGDEQTLLHIPDWDFHWQDVYYLQQPIDATAGDTLRVSCVHDNAPSAQPVVNGKPLPPRYVLWGEGTTDEMCLGIVLVTERP